MRGEDLAPLLAPAGGSDFGFHSGRVLAWDSETGANSVKVAGATLVDVPILNTSEAISLEAGDVIGMLRFKASYFILGRITVPGDADFAPSAVQLEPIDGTEEDFAITGTWTTRATATAAVPAWANEATVHVQSSVIAANDDTTHTAFSARSRIETGAGVSWWGAWSPITLEAGYVRAAPAALAERIVAGELGSSITVGTELMAEPANTPRSAYTRATTTALIVFRRT